MMDGTRYDTTRYGANEAQVSMRTSTSTSTSKENVDIWGKYWMWFCMFLLSFKSTQWTAGSPISHHSPSHPSSVPHPFSISLSLPVLLPPLPLPLPNPPSPPPPSLPPHPLPQPPSSPSFPQPTSTPSPSPLPAKPTYTLLSLSGCVV
jgi:hypothetical protein